MRSSFTLFGKKLLAAFFLLTILNTTVKAQTSLVAGDIAFSGLIGRGASPATDAFSFVLLKAVAQNTTIRMTDYGWRTNTNSFNSGGGTESEAVLLITNPAGFPAGTEIKIENLNATLVGGGSAGTLTYTTGTAPDGSTFISPLSLNGTSGDQILIYQGTMAAPVFIAGLHWNRYTIAGGDPTNSDATNWDGVVSGIYINASTSSKPVALTAGSSALWLQSTTDLVDPEKGNGYFPCGPDVSTIALARTALYNNANWTTNDNNEPVGFTLPTGCNYIGVLSSPPAFTTNPSNSSICEGANTSFTIVATGASSYQWQVDNGGGFANVPNAAPYSGVTGTTLTITAAPPSLNAYLYRCVATNGSGSTNSTSGTLTVTALPVNPTLLSKTPAASTVADGTPVSATFNAGSGGSGGGCTDDYRYTTNGGASYLPYTPGSNISTTGLAAGTGVVTIEGRRAACGSGCQNNYIALATWIVTPLPAGATTLNAGDIAFSSYAAANDEFSFVLLRNIGSGTVVNFTTNGWYSNNTFRTGEETVTWTSNAAYSAGIEIKIAGLTATLASGGSAGTVTGTPLTMSTSGDQILAYRGSTATPTFITGIHMNVYSVPLFGDPTSTTAAAWDGTAYASPAVNTNASALPTGLTTGINAIWIGVQDVSGSEYENAAYGTCAGPGTLGALNTLRSALNNQANWVKDHNTPLPGFVIPTGCPYLGLGNPPNISVNPANSSICELANTSFSITASGATTYQWQVDNGGGFTNVVDGAPYSGATTTTLTITATPLSFNTYQYRCITTNGSGSSTSTAATLTVTALPVGPTLLVKTPAASTVADGTPVSATFNPGSGGTGCADDFRYTTDGGATYLPYTPGANISTTGLAAGSGHVFIEGRRANCSAGCQGTYIVLAKWVVTPTPVAATTLNAGDIAFSGYTSTSTPDEFSFVLLRNIGPGTQINFTDNGWLSTNALQTGESTITWTAPAGGLIAGTEIKISGTTASKPGGGSAGTVTGTPLSLISSGDQILAYRGSAASPTFISAIHMNVYTVANGDPVTTTAAAWDGTANTTSSSALPTGLTTGTNAIWIGTQGVISSEHNNARYGLCNLPAVAGSIVALRAALNNQANWTVDDITPPSFTLPTGCNYLSVLCPTITVTNPVTTTGTAGTAFSQTFTSTGGAPVVTYSTSSTLPAGLTLSTAGLLSGTPTEAGTFPIVVVATDGSGCTGTGSTYNLVISCPAPVTGTATPSSQSICSGTAITTIVLSSSGPVGTVYNWTRDNTVAVTGIATSGTGDISGTLTNTTASPVTVTFTVTPTYYGTCTGTPYTATVLVNPAPTVTATPSSQTICSGAAITTIVLTGNSTYTWTRDNTVDVTGIAANGSGDISGSLTNTTNAPVTVTFTITPAPIGGCTGTPITATVTVNPIPNATATPSSQSRCSGQAISPIVMGGNVSGTSFDWVRDNVGTIGGSIPASGSGNISGNLVNNTGAPVTVTFTITPNANGCPGTPVTATVTVNPLPLAIINGGGGNAVCQNSNYVLSATTDPGYTYAWGRSLFTNPFTPLGTNSTQPINISGNYLLTVTNQYGCVDTAMTTKIIADFSFNGSLAPGDAVQTGRLNRFAAISTCGAPKACPLTFTTTGSRLYDSYTVTNPGNTPVCATIGITSYCGTSIFSAAYTGSYNPTSLCTNYLADPGSSFTSSGFYEATIPASGTIVIVVHEVNPSTGCSGYNLSVNIPRDNFITVSPNDTVCSGIPVILTAPAGNNYTWTPGGATTQAITVNPPIGTTTYSVQSVYGNYGCNANLSQDIVVSTLPTANAVADQYFCNGSTANISFTGTGTPTYNWTNTNPAIGLPASGSGDLNFIATNATAAPISGTITVTPVNGSCTGLPVTFTITVAQTSTITSVTNDSVCAPGGIANLAATGNGLINWYDALTGGTLVNTGTTYTPNITATDTFYVESIVSVPPVQNLTMPAQSNTFPGNVRGYWFTAPADFVITSLSVPTTASSGSQSIAVVKFNGNIPPPVFSATTNAFTTLFLTRNNTTAGNIATNIPVKAGEVIGILGYRGNINSYAPGDYNTTIMGIPVQLQRLGMQFQLTTTDPRDIWREFGATTSISRIEFTYAPLACESAPRVPVTATIKSIPIPTATPVTQTSCSGSPITTIVLAPGTPDPTTYSWTRDNTATVTGIASSGTTDISGTLTNTTNAPITVTFTITATANGCTTAPITATVVVNPTPTVNPVANQIICNNASTTAVNFGGTVTGTVYNWTNNTPSIGLAGSGTGDIASFIATNPTNLPVVATITVTPSYTNAGTTCTGTPITFTITVGPGIASPLPVADNFVSVTFPPAGGWTRFNPNNNNTWVRSNVGNGNVGSVFIDNYNFNLVGQVDDLRPPTISTTGVKAIKVSFDRAHKNFPGLNDRLQLLYSLDCGATWLPTTFDRSGASLATAGSSTANYTVPAAGDWRRDTVTVDICNTTAPYILFAFRITNGYGNNVFLDNIVLEEALLVNPVASQVVCNGAPTAAIAFSGSTVPGTVYNWTNNTTSIGLAASGSGNIASFNAVNTGNAPVVANLSVTPVAGACSGNPQTFTITVNPTPIVNAVGNQVVCNNSATAAINFSSPTTGGTMVYNWTNNTTSIGLASSGSGDIASFTATNITNVPVVATITVTPSYTNAGVTCTGAPITFTITVNPTPNAVATPSTQTICSGGAITSIALTGNVVGTVFNWSRDNNVDVIGIASSGSGAAFISGNLTNLTNAPVTVTFTVTPSYTNGGVTCTGPSVTATVVVNPIPNAVATPASQTTCSGTAITPIALTGNVTGTVYNWTRDNAGTVTGIAGSGAGNISGTLTNTTNAPVTVTFTITPSFTNAGATCTGTPVTATVVVNPTPNAVAAPTAQTICSGSNITNIALTGNVVNTVFNWTRNNTATVTGIGASGSGDISGSLTNTTNAPITVTFTITPSYTNGGVTCSGTPVTATVVVNPIPNAVAAPSAQTICSGSAITTIALTGNVTGTVYNWTRDNTGTVTGIAPGGTGNIAGLLTNTTTSPMTVTFTITPSYTNAGATCTGAPIFATVVVNPIPDAIANPGAQTICSGSSITPINSNGNVIGTVFNWTRNNTATVTGIAASGTGTISGSLTNTTNAPVTVTFTITPSYTNAGVTCTGTPTTATVVVNPIPNAVAAPATQTICTGSAITAIALSGNVTGTVYNWTRNNTGNVSGIANSGTGNITGTLTSNTNVPETVTFTITPSYTNAGVTCTGTPTTATVIVNPIPTVNGVSSQVVCSNSSTAAVNFSGAVTGTVYNWTNNTPAIGLGSSGTGNIPSFTATNTGTTPLVATITVTPSYTNAGTTCTGTPITFTITVNPRPTVNAVASQSRCTNTPTAAVTFTGAVTGTVFNWTNNNASIGLASSGTGNIPSFIAINTGNSPVVATITVTPVYTNGGVSCSGTAITFTITVNPLPNIIFTGVPARVCLTDTILKLRALPAGGTWSGRGVTGDNFNAVTAGIGVTTISYTVTDGNGCTGTEFRNITVQDCQERHNRLAGAVWLFPNPNTGRFNVRFNTDLYKEANVRIIDPLGQVLREYKFSNLFYGSVIPFDLRGVPSGTYILQIYNGTDFATLRVVIGK